MATDNCLFQPLRRARKEAGLGLKDLKAILKAKGCNRCVSYLSLLERGKVWPSKEIVNALVDNFNGKLSHMDILYPELSKDGEINDGR